jgi:hypothetical protein
MLHSLFVSIPWKLHSNHIGCLDMLEFAIDLAGARTNDKTGQKRTRDPHSFHEVIECYATDPCSTSHDQDMYILIPGEKETRGDEKSGFTREKP